MRHVIAAAAIAGLMVGQCSSDVTGMGLMPKLFLEFGALGVLGWYCYYVTKSTIPGITQQYCEEAQKQRESDAARTEAVCQSQERQMTQVSDVMKEMIRNCANRRPPADREG